MGNRSLFQWDGDELIIGRAVDAGLRLDDGHASRLHARLNRAAGHYVIADLNSGNGLYVNDERVSQRVLGEGDVIRVGHSRIIVETAGAPHGLRFREADSEHGRLWSGVWRTLSEPSAGRRRPRAAGY